MDKRTPIVSTVAVIEDDVLMREHLCAFIRSDPDLSLMGVAWSLTEGEALLRRRPDIAVLDISLLDGCGLDLLHLRETGECGDCKFLILTVFGDEASVMRALTLGADGYLIKDVASAQFLQAVKGVLAGEAPLSAPIATYLLRRFRQQNTVDSQAGTLLSPREMELLRLFATGMTNKEAARALGLSPHTVNDKAKVIFRKLQVSSRAEAVYKAMHDGLLKS